MLSLIPWLVSAHAATLTVGPEATYTTISSAIAASVDGDTVLVGPGIYAEALFLGDKTLTISASESPATTFITGDGEYTVSISSDDATETVINGFSLQGEAHSCLTTNATNLTLMNMVIYGCGSALTPGGGGLNIQGGSLNMSDVTVRDNMALDGAGLAASDGAIISIDGCIFQHNIATNGGGGISVKTGASLSIDDTEFLDNHANFAEGGGLWLLDAGTTSLNNLIFQDNHAWAMGGAISARNLSDFSIQNSSFDNNVTGAESGGGGAIAVHSSNVSIYGLGFSGNLTAGSGGAIFSDESVVSADNITLEDNTALRNGGGWHQDRGDLSISNTLFIRNIAGSDGGGLFSSADSSMISGSRLAWNEASGGQGGGIKLMSVNTTIFEVDLQRNTAREGGGLYAQNGATFAMSMSIIQENEAIFSTGGALVIGETTTNATLQNNNFLGNGTLSSGEIAQIGLGGMAVDLRNNIIADGINGLGVGIVGEPPESVLFTHNNIFSNDGGSHILDSSPATIAENIALDPGFVRLSLDRNFTNDDLDLMADSPCFETGDPSLASPDGRASNIGARGLSSAPDPDSDGDGYTLVEGGDCDDENPAVHPEAEEVCDDGIDNNCDGHVDEGCDSDTGLTTDTGEPELPVDVDDSGDMPTSGARDDLDSGADGLIFGDDGHLYEINGQGCQCSGTQSPPLWWAFALLPLITQRRRTP
jgi:predicted outer membrane repeat protein